jgi:hypothetical protein
MTAWGETNLFVLTASAGGGSNRLDRLNGYYGGEPFPSLPSKLVTLSSVVEMESGISMSTRKLIPRVFLYTLHDGQATVALKSTPDRKKKITWEWEDGMVLNELMLDSGFERDSALSIESVGTNPLTLLALVLDTTVGG